MQHNYEDLGPSDDHVAHETHESAHSSFGKKLVTFLGIATVLFMVVGFTLQNFSGSKHGSAMSKVESINSKNLDLVDKRAQLRLVRDKAKADLDKANSEIKTIEESIRANKAEVSTLLKTIYE